MKLFDYLKVMLFCYFLLDEQDHLISTFIIEQTK